MKLQFLFLKLCSVLLVFSISSDWIFAEEKKDSTFQRNALSLDIVPFYFDFFDNRIQARMGFEYKRLLSRKSFLSFYTDLGLYDSYDFVKYYNLFNEGSGFYSVKQHVSIKGIHQLPGFNYIFLNFRKNPSNAMFVGPALDISFYQKEISTTNTLTSSKFSDKYYQLRIGAGSGVGFKLNFAKHFFAEIKTSLFIKLVNSLSEKDRIPMMSLDAQWTSPDYRFWWISNLKIGYAF